MKHCRSACLSQICDGISVDCWVSASENCLRDALQAVAEESRKQVNIQDLARGIAQRAAQQSSGAGAIQPKDAVAAAKAGMFLPCC